MAVVEATSRAGTARWALVTGAARGIGAAIAARLAADGSAVALLDVSPEVVPVAKRLATGDRTRPVVGIVADVTDEAAVEWAVAETTRRLGGLDLLVNNAGVGGLVRDLVESALDSLRRIVEVNLLGPMLVARATARAMIATADGGAVVNVGSMLGQRPSAGAVAYCASKAGVAAMTQALALELAPHGIRVNAIAPGSTATEMHWRWLRAEAERTGTDFEQQVAAVREAVPLGRHGTGEDVAALVAWLASPEASYVTGQVIGVDGGASLL